MILRNLLLVSYLLFCGGEERWDVKTLTDPDASKVNFTPQSTSISKLIALPLPKVGKNQPRQGIEFQTYSIAVYVEDYFKEADGDIHLVIEDAADRSKKMIAEIPNPGCDRVVGSLKIKDIQQTHKTFDSLSVKNLVRNHRFTICGVGFVDLKHPRPQRGVAPNEVEIHPVLNFKPL